MAGGGRAVSEAPGPPFEVAVVVPVRDGEAYLAEALESVLSQDVAPQEVVVVDDGSRDRSAEVARAAGPRVRVVSQGPLGAGAARNRGVEATRAPWIAFLDADDRWVPGKLRLQRDALAAAPGAVASIGRIRQFHSPDLGRSDRPDPEVVAGTSPITLVVRRDAFLATGGFPTDLRASEAPAWWVRFEATRPAIVRLDAVLAERRIHARNTGVLRAADARAEYLRLAKAMLDRRRGNGA
jgi:glycosyltransferase involved in cell wall biosynthesis